MGLVLEAHGEVSDQDRHLIDEATSFQAHALVCVWLLREKHSEMTHTDIQATSRDIAQAKTGRNKAMTQLGLNNRSDMWGILDATATPHTEDAGSSTNGQPASPSDGDGDEYGQQDSQPSTCGTSRSEQPGTASPLEG